MNKMQEKCAIITCENPRAEVPNEGENKYFDFCLDHKCKLNSCHRYKAGVGPVKGTEDFMYCLEHTCSVDGCRHCNCAEDPRKYFAKMCLKHSCKVVGCPELTIPDKLLCQKHCCRVIGCFEPISSSIGVLCQKHCCSAPGCLQHRMGKNYCEKHCCEFLGCEELTTNTKCCNQHTCGYDDCNDPQELGSSECSYHRKPRVKECYFNECHMESSPPSKFCDTHKCWYPSCIQPSPFGGLFCADHKCQKCLNQKLAEGKYCEDCTCKFADCTNKISSKAKDKVCSDHIRNVPKYGYTISSLGVIVCSNHKYDREKCPTMNNLH